jgi:hypothetical protein
MMRRDKTITQTALERYMRLAHDDDGDSDDVVRDGDPEGNVY